MDSTRLMDTMADYVKNLLNDLRNIPNKLADEIESLNCKIDCQFNFVKEEIQLRIESLRAKLDDIQASFELKIEESKEKTKESIFTSLNIQQLKDEVKQLELKLNSDDAKLETFHNIHQLSSKINATLASIRNYSLNIKFSENKKFNIYEDDIGLFHSCLAASCECMVSFDVLNNFKHKLIHVDFNPLEILQLPDNRYLVATTGKNNLIFIDSNFKNIKRFKRPYRFDDYKAQSITGDSIYVYVCFTSRIIKYNQDFEKVCQQSYSDINNILLFEDKLYLCKSNYIIVLTKDLQYIATHYLNLNYPDSKLLKIRIINNVACINCKPSATDAHKIQFYRLPIFDFITEYDVYAPAITIYKNCFYVYNRLYFNCFNSDGKYLAFRKYSLGVVDDMIVVDDNLIMSLSQASCFAIAKLN